MHFSSETELWRVTVLPNSVPTRLSLGWAAITYNSAQDGANPSVSWEHSACSDRHTVPPMGVTSSVALLPSVHPYSHDDVPVPKKAMIPVIWWAVFPSFVIWSDSFSQLFSPWWWECRLLIQSLRWRGLRCRLLVKQGSGQFPGQQHEFHTFILKVVLKKFYSKVQIDQQSPLK